MTITPSKDRSWIDRLKTVEPGKFRFSLDDTVLPLSIITLVRNKINRCLLYLFFVGTGLPVLGQQFVPVNEGSQVSFKIKNFGFSVSGTFTGLSGMILFDPVNPEKCSFDVSLDASSVNTGNEMRDHHLREEDYFDVNHFPKIHFVSSRVTGSGQKRNYMICGKLTIKNQTKDISFPFSALASGNDILLIGEFKLNRRDFNIGGSSTIADNLQLSLSVLAKNLKK